jgi:predicted transcriptional regulator
VKKPAVPAVTRRESQIMAILHRRGSATAAEILAELPDPPGYSSARKLLEILEKKGFVRHRQDGPRYVYAPVARRDQAQRSALKQLVHTFFGGSVEETAVALFAMSEKELSPETLDRLRALAEKAKRKGGR